MAGRRRLGREQAGDHSLFRRLPGQAIEFGQLSRQGLAIDAVLVGSIGIAKKVVVEHLFRLAIKIAARLLGKAQQAVDTQGLSGPALAQHQPHRARDTRDAHKQHQRQAVDQLQTAKRANGGHCCLGSVSPVGWFI